jgi:hypothetical protein
MTIPDYHDDMCAAVIELGSQGYSECQISARIGIPRTTMRSWCDVHPQFSSALTRAKELEQDWWETKAQDNLETKEFNANLWNKSVSSRFRKDYGDKVQIDGEGGFIPVKLIRGDDAI